MTYGFDDREIPLVPHALYGMRTFNYSDEGDLRALYMTDEAPPYSNDLNSAMCVHLDHHVLAFTHHPPVKECTCGFYAYFEDATHYQYLGNETPGWGRITGVVEATGRCIVGDLGFRAEKVKIVGLIADTSSIREPKKKGLTRRRKAAKKVNDFTENFAREFYDKFTMKKLFSALGMYWLILLLSILFSPEPMKNVINSTMTLLSVSAIIVSFMAAYGAKVTFNKKIGEVTHRHKLSPETLRAIMEKYPDAQIFPSLQEIHNAYPLTKASQV